MTRQPPWDNEAEEALLGAMLLSPAAIDAAADHCTADDLYRPAHALIYAAIAAVHTTGTRADPVTVADELRRQHTLDQVGGPAALLALQAAPASIGSAARYASIVRDLATLRRMAAAGAEITDLAYSAPDDVPAAVDRAEQIAYTLGQRTTTGTAAGIDDLIDEAVDHLERLHARGDTLSGTPTGFYDLDATLSGLQRSDLIILGARPSVGKTAWALAVARNVACVARLPTLFFSLEMSKLQLTTRLLSEAARVDGGRLRSGQLYDSDWAKISRILPSIHGSPLWIDDNPAVTLLDIRSRARRLKADHGRLGLVVVDYIQLMTGRGRAENRQVEVAEISRGLKVMARELDCPVLALSQLSRNLEQRADKRPKLSDLRETGALEQDADVVIFLYRDDVYQDDSPDRGTAEVIVAKHRSGATGTTRLAFLADFAAFVNMARL